MTIWAGRLGVEIVKGEMGGDPASVAHRAVARALETGADVCIVDTAGRLQTQQNLMAELGKIRRVISKQIPEAPHEVLLVLDATTGQNGISQAKHFTEAVQCTGIMLAKIDGTAKGGVVVAIRRQVGLPVKFLGVGETADDLARFEPDAFVDAMFADMRIAAVELNEPRPQRQRATPRGPPRPQVPAGRESFSAGTRAVANAGPHMPDIQLRLSSQCGCAACCLKSLQPVLMRPC